MGDCSKRLHDSKSTSISRSEYYELQATDSSPDLSSCLDEAECKEVLGSTEIRYYLQGRDLSMQDSDDHSIEVER